VALAIRETNMKLARYSVGTEPRLGLMVDAGVVDLARAVPAAPADIPRLMGMWHALAPELAQAAQRQPDHGLSEVTLLAPIARPGKILAIGLNYLDHIEETGALKPVYPVFFAKMPNAANGPFDAIQRPAVSVELDYEAEMVVVVGKRCRNVPRDRARDVIFGYCVGNDVSVRDWQKRTSQWVVGKSFDGHAPFGPWITTAGEMDPHNLGIRCCVNGEIRQNSNTKNLLFDSYAQIAYLSQAMTLEPGDLIFTGTPGGVGMGYKPPNYLNVGDIVRVEIDRLGAIENRVEAGSAQTFIEREQEEK
jgi:2-keto-4-pentenoate hydratase/2-oxohepta-3-ene-1,7-dioic acid hydratase in catechol pathway